MDIGIEYLLIIQNTTTKQIHFKMVGDCGDSKLYFHFPDVDLSELETGEHRYLHVLQLFLRRGAGTSKTEQVVAANVDTLFLCMAESIAVPRSAPRRPGGGCRSGGWSGFFR